jgi:hypothetical protein
LAQDTRRARDAHEGIATKRHKMHTKKDFS